MTGRGRDDVFAAVGFNPQQDPPGEPLHVIVRIDGGADDDTIRAAFDLAGRRDVTLRAELLGGRGHDDLGLALAGLSDPEDFTALIDGRRPRSGRHHCNVPGRPDPQHRRALTDRMSDAAPGLRTRTVTFLVSQPREECHELPSHRGRAGPSSSSVVTSRFGPSPS
jgi:hypothetical protein